jgi:hypothetical protein
VRLPTVHTYQHRKKTDFCPMTFYGCDVDKILALIRFDIYLERCPPGLVALVLFRLPISCLSFLTLIIHSPQPSTLYVGLAGN